MAFRLRRVRDGLPRPTAVLAALAVLLLCARPSVSSDDPDGTRKRRLVLHLGPHRTGSSYLQARLSVEGGLSKTLLHPKLCGRTTDPKGWRAFAEYLCSGKEPDLGEGDCHPGSDAFIESFRKGHEDLIISAEHLSMCGEDSLVRLRDMFPEFTIEALVVKRNTQALLLSRYKARYPSSVSTLLDVSLRGDTDIGLCSYVDAKCLKVLSRVFGHEHVHVVSYEGMELAGKSLFQVVCDTFSPDDECFEAYDGPERVKPSVPYVEYSASVIFNRLSMLASCKKDLRAEVGSTSKGGKLLKSFLKSLEEIGVQPVCYPVEYIFTTDCYECFCKSIMDGTFSVRHYLFEEGEASHGNLGDICEYSEALLIRNENHLQQVSKTIEQLHGCTK